jgi:hypothetical protein
VDLRFTCQHPAEDAFEEYAFGRLSEEDSQILEEHLLVCVPCQETLGAIDEMILSLKRGLLGALPPGRVPAPVAVVSGAVADQG